MLSILLVEHPTLPAIKKLNMELEPIIQGVIAAGVFELIKFIAKAIVRMIQR